MAPTHDDGTFSMLDPTRDLLAPFFGHLWPLAALLLACVTMAIGSGTERGLLAFAGAGALAAIWVRDHRHMLATIVLVLLLAALLTLGTHLLVDDFGYRYVWLYSAAELPAYLKVANLWGGEEGTLLLLATVFALAARRLSAWAGWAGPGALLLTVAFTLGTLIWDPFAPTPLDAAGTPPRGMNAHLMSPWMALHPPLLFGAYVLVLAPVGAALEALARGRGDWVPHRRRWTRGAWLILSSGLVAGMWWAYEDFSFGQVWHWDPVQTSVFVVWALLTAELHGHSRYHPRGRFALLVPGLAALAGIATLLSMAITRDPVLASSHRYVGDSSLPLLLTMAGGLAVATLWALILGLRRRRAKTPRPGEPTALLIAAIAGLVVAAVAGAWHIGLAYLGAWLDWARPASLKPFFETLTRFAQPGEVLALSEAFDKWDVDRYAMNAWLAPVLIVLTLAGGHHFLPIRRPHARLTITVAVFSLAVLSALVLEPVGALFRGTGITSSSTVAIFPWLDALVVTSTYLLLAALAALIGGQPRVQARFWSYRLPVAVIHAGLIVALIAGSAATVFDSHAQRTVAYPLEFGTPIRFADGCVP